MLAYTPDSRWRNRAEFPRGRAEIEAFLTRKWTRELDYRLIKELWTFAGNRIAVRFAYEYHDDSGQWFRAYGNENWQFDAAGLHRTKLSPPKADPNRQAWPIEFATLGRSFRHLLRRASTSDRVGLRLQVRGYTDDWVLFKRSL